MGKSVVLIGSVVALAALLFILPFSGASSAPLMQAPSPTPTTQPVAYWPFDEGSGTTAADASGNGHTGTLQGGATWANGNVGKAVDLNGAGAYVSIPDGPGLDGMTALTFDAWVFLRAYPSSYNHYSAIFSKWGTGGASDDSYNLEVDWNGNWSLEVSDGLSTGPTISVRTAVGLFPLNKWVRVTATWKTPGDIHLYLDGVEVSGSYYSGTGQNTSKVNDNSQPVWIGRSQHGELTFLNALVDEVKIYNAVVVPVTATLTVTKTADTNDGVCDADCSLREAIAAAKSGDSVAIPAGTYTLTLGSQLTINKDMTLAGNGAANTIVQAATGAGVASWRVLNVTGGNVAISGVTIRFGKADHGGGIYNAGMLTVSNSTVSNNTATTHGAGLYNVGSLTLKDSTITGNTISVTGGGAGVFNSGGTATISGSTISNNGGPSVDGGGILNRDGTMIITNSTISGNQATEGDGGGILNVTSTLTISNSTIANNASVHSRSGGIKTQTGGVVLLSNIILANQGNCIVETAIITSNGYNLSSDSTCGFSSTGDLVSVDPKLGPLADNGGPTKTHALLSGSPAIDAGNPATPGGGGNACPATDQRGVARPVDGNGDSTARCDIGAYESQPVPVAYWPFDEGSGTTAADASGHGHTGTLQNGATWATGKVGMAVSLDGVNDQLSVADHPALDGMAAITVDAWVYPTNPTKSFFQPIVSKWNDQGGAQQRAYALYIQADGRAVMEISHNGTYLGANGKAVSNASVQANQWVRLTGTFDTAIGIVRIYVNGVLAAEKSTGVNQLHSNNEPLFIGAGDGGGEGRQYFIGLLDEVKVYNAVVPPSSSTPGPATKLAFTVQPGNAAAGATITPMVHVAVQDAAGNTVTTATTPVTIAIGTNPGGGILSGTLTVNAVNGMAMFANLSINNVGNGYTLVASVTGLTGAVSIPFNVTAPVPVPPPPPPLGLQAVAGNGQVSLSWNAVTGATFYILYMASTPWTTWSANLPGAMKHDHLTSTSFLHTDLTNGTTYYFAVAAVGAGGEGAQSSQVSATPAAPPIPPPVRVAFLAQPSNAAAGATIAPAVQVEAQNASGSRVTNYAASINIAIGANPGGGTLSGTLTVSAVNGVASFANLSIDKVGNGYTLSASATNLTGATSNPFNVTGGISFHPTTLALGTLGASGTVMVRAAGVNPGADGVQLNIQHSGDVTITSPACVGIFQGANPLGPTVIAGGTLVSCFLGPGAGDVKGTTGDVMTFVVTRAGTGNPLLTFGLGGGLGTQFSNEGIPISPGVTNTLQITGGTTISGTVTLQGRTATFPTGVGHGIATVTLSPGGLTTGVNADGSFTLPGVLAGTFTLTASAAGYVSRERTSVVVEGSPVSVPTVQLRCGLVDNNIFVNINDITATVAAFGKALANRVDALGRFVDQNGDGFVNINDITCVVSGFGLTSPQVWP